MTDINRLATLAGISLNNTMVNENPERDVDFEESKQDIVEGNALVWYDLAPLGDDADLFAELDELLAADAGHNSTQLPNDAVQAAYADPRTSAARRPDSHIGIPISYKQTLGWLDTVGATILDESNKSKPDFLDIDGDGDKEEPMKKAVKDKNVSEQMREWANSVDQQYEDRGTEMEQPEGETVDLSLRRYLDANAQPVQMTEGHTEDSMIREYEEFKKAGQLDEFYPGTHRRRAMDKSTGKAKVNAESKEKTTNTARLRKLVGLGSVAEDEDSDNSWHMNGY